MRLHRLSLQAFGPYPTRQTIDFDQLAGSGLFLLEGPTGAGKSTVLDALTFGLYGELSAETTTKDRLHSDFADPSTTPEVTVECSVRGRRLRITRVPEHERPRKRGAGTTIEAASVHLEELRAGTAGSWCTLSSNKAEAGELVTDAMGLSRAQFTQVVLLPQGEFARFLRADDDARRELLTTLFGTHLYDRITDDLDSRRYDAEQARAEARHHVEHALAAAGQAAGLDADARDALVALGPTAHEQELALIATGLAAADQQAQVAADLARSRLASAATARERAEQLAERVQRAITARARLDEHVLTRGAHEQRVEALARARRAEPVRPLLDLVAGSERSLAQARAALLTLVADPPAGALQGEGADAAAGRAAAAAAEAARLTHAATLEAGLPARRDALAQSRRDATTAQERVAELERTAAEVPARIAAHEAQLAAATTTAAPLQSAQDRLPQLADRLAAALEIGELDPVIAAQHLAWQAVSAEHVGLVREHERLTAQRLTGMSAELATALTPGMPCGVCGSLDHPAPADPAAEAVTADDVDRAALARDACAARTAAEEARLRRLTGRRDVLSGSVADRTAADLRAEVDALQQTIASGTAAAAQVESLAAEVEALRVLVAATASDLTAATAHATAAAGRAAAAEDRVDADAAEVEAELAGYASVGARQAALLALGERERGIGARIAAVATELAALGRAGDHAHAEATGQGFADLAEARAAALDTAAVSSLAAEVAGWDRQLAAHQAALAAPDLRGIDVSAAPAALAALADAQHAWQQADAAYAVASDAHAAAGRTARAWSQCQADLRRAKAAHSRTHDETAAVIRLAALAKGTGGQRKVALTTYVLRHWFTQVVQAANTRLAVMSAGRYELERSDEAESRAKRAGLTLTVIDRYTGERRHPKSLSGGETFFTSLALALGLAEVVTAEAGGVDLDTLFIDEGFGSLDAATLDQVMEVIDALRDRGRVVGIVSHVTDLKDRIPERLEVRRVADGSSTLRVVA